MTKVIEVKRIKRRELLGTSHPILENEIVKLGIGRKNVFKEI